MKNQKKSTYTRREFIKQNSLAGAGGFLAMGFPPALWVKHSNKKARPAILGGEPVKKNPWPKWPQWRSETDEERVLEVIRSGVWSRSNTVAEFENIWAETVGSKRCLTTVNGTNALICSLSNLGIGGGDEVLLPPYTFISCPQAILMNGAIPVFVDTDPVTFQMDPDQIENKITSRTRAIMPVHLGGCPADMLRIMKIADRYDLLVIEDACQAWLSEINHKQVGTFGHAGCYSFQNSKNIPIGEGGAIVSDNDDFMDQCYSFHNFGNPYGSVSGAPGSGTQRLGTKLRLTEYQAAIGLAQLKRFEEQTDIRSTNGNYLREQMSELSGITPHVLNPGVTRVSYHLFTFHYDKEAFQGLSRDGFRRALGAEGVPVSTGYSPLNKMPYLQNAFQSKNFQLMYPSELLDYDSYVERNHCPENDKICNETGLWFRNRMLLGDQSDMNLIIESIQKVHRHAGDIKKELEG